MVSFFAGKEPEMPRFCILAALALLLAPSAYADADIIPVTVSAASSVGGGSGGSSGCAALGGSGATVGLLALLLVALRAQRRG